MSVTWLPAWPAAWTDWVESYTAIAPSWWPRGLWGRDSAVHQDAEALGEVMGYGRQLLGWIGSTVLPLRDQDGQWLPGWETSFGILARATVADRQDDLTAAMRRRGTLTEAKLKSIFCRCWGSDDPAAVGIALPFGVDVVDCTLADQKIRWSNYLHIYNAAGSTGINLPLAKDLLAAVVPTWADMTIGDTDHSNYGSSSGTTRARYNRCCYSSAP